MEEFFSTAFAVLLWIIFIGVVYLALLYVAVFVGKKSEDEMDKILDGETKDEKRKTFKAKDNQFVNHVILRRKQ